MSTEPENVRPGNKPAHPPTSDPEPWTDGMFRYAHRCRCGCMRWDPRTPVPATEINESR